MSSINKLPPAQGSLTGATFHYRSLNNPTDKIILTLKAEQVIPFSCRGDHKPSDGLAFGKTSAHRDSINFSYAQKQIQDVLSQLGPKDPGPYLSSRSASSWLQMCQSRNCHHVCSLTQANWNPAKTSPGTDSARELHVHVIRPLESIFEQAHAPITTHLIK